MRTAALIFAVVALTAAGCSSPEESKTSDAMAERMKEIERRIKESMPKTQELALEQKVPEDTVRAAQENLKKLHEYLDEASGKIDMVTVNAIQAFQRRVGLTDDGMLDDRTVRRLQEEAAKS